MSTKPHQLRLPLVLSLLIGLLLITIPYLYHRSHPRIGPVQPIAFSHRVHTQDKQISCYICHEGAQNSSHAGVPPLDTCMLCHQRIIIYHPEIQQLRDHYIRNQPVHWRKVTDLPDFVFFHHGVHLQRGVDCSACHGNLKAMDRVQEANDFTMGFCLGCHRAKQATLDCYACHR